MDEGVAGAEMPKARTTTMTSAAREQVFQPPKLREIVEVIDLMGTVASRVREDKSGDLPTAAGANAGKAAGQTSAATARDEAIARAPAPAIMQRKLVQHLEQEVKRVEKQARVIARSKKSGSAYLLSELYKKIRRLSSLIKDILEASTEMIKRFYISVFIDHQPLVVTGGSLKEEEK